MDEDGDDKDDSKRRTRNLSEKKRRDQFNMLVNELSSMVSSNSRKMDKSTVLKATISFLKNHNEITVRSRAHDVQEDWKPTFLSNEEFTFLILESLEGFIMVFSASGRIFYVSESISSLLGHNPATLINQSIFDLTFDDDRQTLYNLLQNPESAVDPLSVNKENVIRFQCHLRRGTLDLKEETTYELIQFNGHFRTNTDQMDSDEMPYQDHKSRILFVCTGRLYTPQLIRDVSLVDTNRNEFTSRHSLEWKFLFLDHRAPPIIGYLPFEVLGTSGYDYYHFDDLEKVVTCHEALMQKGEMTSCYYRFLTKGQQWIWLQTRFYITYHQWNSKPEFVVCTHRVVSYADIAKSMKNESTETKADAEAGNDVETTCDGIPDTPSEDTIVTLSPSYMSAASDAFTTYQQISQGSISQPASVKSASASSTTGTVATTGTAGASWSRTALTLYTAGGSDTASVSGESRSSQRKDCSQETQKAAAPALVPQHGIGAQYLDPAPYVSAVGVPGVLPLPLPSLPVLVSPDQAQIQVLAPTVTVSAQRLSGQVGAVQRCHLLDEATLERFLQGTRTVHTVDEEQLQRKHEELQQMIVQQQEELRQVKEQLLLARLGMLQPIINVQSPYVTTEELPNTQRPQILYEMAALRPAAPAYPPQQPQQPPHPNHHQHMPQ